MPWLIDIAVLFAAALVGALASLWCKE